MTVESHFDGKDPAVRATYLRLLGAARVLGPVVEEPKKTSIHLMRHTAFAGVATRRSSLILTLKSAKDVRNARIHKREQTSAHRWHLEIRGKTNRCGSTAHRVVKRGLRARRSGISIQVVPLSGVVGSNAFGQLLTRAVCVLARGIRLVKIAVSDRRRLGDVSQSRNSEPPARRKCMILKRRDGGVVDRARLENEAGD
jgi:hypothetical protein